MANSLLEQLESGEATVNFKKVDGTARSMRCTRCKVFMPSDAANSVQPFDSGESNLPVWDLDKQGWRSFRIDSVIDWQ